MEGTSVNHTEPELIDGLN